MTDPSPIIRIMSTVSEAFIPEVLARVAKCSKPARASIAPAVERMLQAEETLRHMILRLLPALTNIPSGKDPTYYRILLDRYFAPSHQPHGALQVQVNYAVGYTLNGPKQINVREMTYNLIPYMQTVGGRRMIARAVQEWRAAVTLQPVDNKTIAQLEALDDMARALKADFIVKFDQINTQYDWCPP